MELDAEPNTSNPNVEVALHFRESNMRNEMLMRERFCCLGHDGQQQNKLWMLMWETGVDI